jgi:peptidoglycan/xylan/chitin deacetylase (PgdA/CDA1 family)
MEEYGIKTSLAKFFLPPYEWYNKTVISWGEKMGLTTLNFTPGIRTNADYTTPEMTNYRSSEQIIKDLKKFEAEDSNGLNGALVLIHLGTSPVRKDKLYEKLDELLDYLQKKGYQMCGLNEL